MKVREDPIFNALALVAYLTSGNYPLLSMRLFGLKLSRFKLEFTCELSE